MTGLPSRLAENDIIYLKFMNYTALIKLLGPPENFLRDARDKSSMRSCSYKGNNYAPSVSNYTAKAS